MNLFIQDVLIVFWSYVLRCSTMEVVAVQMHGLVFFLAQVIAVAQLHLLQPRSYK